MSTAVASASAAPPPDQRPRNGKPPGLPIFPLALLIGVILHLGALALFRVSLEPVKTPPPAPPFVHYSPAQDVAQNEVAREEEQLFDPESLYLPTSHNFSSQATRPPLVHPPTVFNDANQIQITPAEGEFHQLTSSVKTTETNNTLNPLQWSFLQTVGLTPSHIQPLKSHGARLRITRQGTGLQPRGEPQIVDWPDAMAPPAGNDLWKPTRFSLMFNLSGLIAKPMLVSTSGNEKVDEDLLTKLQQWFSERPLPQGEYDVEIAP